MREAFLDNRGLEPPQPMIRTLEKLDSLDDGDVLTIHNDRVPVYLFPQLLDLGASYTVDEQADGSAVVRITKAPVAAGG
ncbi:MAG TPA: DUF2249 domain-containing protein [Trueperaceae bacterium]|nr:DUF2249 domain-containing protein [Trueperaceae bacterium]